MERQIILLGRIQEKAANHPLDVLAISINVLVAFLSIITSQCIVLDPLYSRVSVRQVS